MKNVLTEAIGTFFLVLTVGLSGDPLAIGCVLAILVYAGAPLSGAHYNPAVSLALFLRRKITEHTLIRYITAQIIGGVLAGVCAFLFRQPFSVQPTSDIPWLLAATGEALFTFLLVFVIFQVAVNKKTQGNQYFGLAIGGTLFVAASTMGALSGGAFNPAVGIGPLLANVFTGTRPFDPALFFLYIIGPATGAAIAAYVYGYTQREKTI